MKKPVIAIAAFSALAAGSAMAQTSVTIYGIADIAFQYLDPKVEGEGSTKNLVSGARSGSRLGFRGNEDLGGGLNAIFTLEHGLNLDTGTAGQGGRMWGRQAFVGFRSTSFGTLVAGRLAPFSGGTGSFDMMGDLDPLATSYGMAGVESSLSSTSGLRTDNTVLYQTPTFGGLQAGVAHSREIAGQETDSPASGTFLGVRYATGAFATALTYDIFKNNNGGDDQTVLQLAAAYDVGLIKLYAAYGIERNQFNADLSTTETENGADAKGYMIGFTAPFGQSLIRASYQLRDGDEVDGDERDRRVASLAYEYKLSKRTMLYAAVSDSDGKKTLDQNSDYDRRWLALGVNHRF